MTHETRDESGLTARPGLTARAGLTAGYEIRVRGELGVDWSDWFAGPVVAAPDGGETVMTGSLDQAALHAVLRRIRDLGLPLTCVRRIERVEPDGTAADEWIDSLEDQS